MSLLAAPVVPPGAAAEDASDGQLLHRFALDRDQAAFTLLVARHGPLAFSVCRRILGRHHDAEDAFQAVFLVLARRAASLRGGPLGGWLHGVAVRAALETKRRRQRGGWNRVALPPDVPAPLPDEGVDEAALARLDVEVQRLPDKLRAAIILCELQGQSRREAARQLRVPEGTLSSRLAAGRTRLAERLRAAGFAAVAVGLLLSEARANAAPPVHAARLAAQPAHAAGTSAEIAAVTMKALFLRRLKPLAAGLAFLITIITLLCWPRGATEPLAVQPPAPQMPPFAWAVAATKDGKHLVVIEQLHLVRLWNLDTRQPGLTFEGPTQIIRSLVFSPDGRTLAGGGDEGKIFLWNAQTGKLRAILAGHEGKLYHLAFSPDGKLLAAGSQKPPVGPAAPPGELRLWDPATGEKVRGIELGNSLPIGGGVVFSFTPNGQELAVLQAGPFSGVCFFDLQGKETQRLPAPAGQMPQCLALAPDGQMLALSISGPAPEARPGLFGAPLGQLDLWDRRAGQVVRNLLQDADGHIKAVVFAPDGKQLYASATIQTGEIKNQGGALVGRLGGIVYCWETEKWRRKWEAEGPGGMTSGLAPTGDGQCLAVADSSGCWVIADTATGKGRLVLWQRD